MFPFVLVFEEKFLSHFRERIVRPSAAARLGAPVFINKALGLQPFQTAVKRGLFQSVLSAAFILYFAEDIISVAVSFPENAQDYSIDMAANKIAVNRIKHKYILSHIVVFVNNNLNRKSYNAM